MGSGQDIYEILRMTFVMWTYTDFYLLTNGDRGNRERVQLLRGRVLRHVGHRRGLPQDEHQALRLGDDRDRGDQPQWLATPFNGDLTQWQTSSVSNMGYMFSGATSFDGDLSQWQTSRA